MVLLAVLFILPQTGSQIIYDANFRPVPVITLRKHVNGLQSCQELADFWLRSETEEIINVNDVCRLSVPGFPLHAGIHFWRFWHFQCARSWRSNREIVLGALYFVLSTRSLWHRILIVEFPSTLARLSKCFKSGLESILDPEIRKSSNYKCALTKKIGSISPLSATFAESPQI